MLPPSAIIQKGGFSMTEHEKYQEHIRHTHDAFCKTVIRHAAIDAARSIRSRYWRPAEIASKGPARKANCGAKEKAITEFFQILYTEQ